MNFFRRWFVDEPFWLLLLLAGFFQYLRAPASIALLVSLTIAHAAVYRGLYQLIKVMSPWKLSLLWIGLPLLIFAVSWLRIYWAVILALLWGGALWRAIHSEPPIQQHKYSVGGFLLVLVWVNLCGAGGYGFQSWDYVMHNGKLMDLVQYTWPVYYPQADQQKALLVQYAGYYLPAALVGKAFGVQAAMAAQHLWALCGCWLALTWLLVLSGLRSSVVPAVGMILFGGYDIAGVIWQGWSSMTALQPLELMAQLRMHVLYGNGFTVLDFWPAQRLHATFWSGNFVGLTTNLFLAPNQTIACWLTIALLLHGWRTAFLHHCLFIYALLAFWSPMGLMGMSVIVVIMLAYHGKNNFLRWVTWENVVAGGSVLLVLGCYYFSASAATQPRGIVIGSELSISMLAVFTLAGWGMYAGLLLCCRLQGAVMRVFAGAVFMSMGLISLIHYGVFNDLLVRSSAAFMYGVLLLFLCLLQNWWSNGKKLAAIWLVILLAPGSISALLNLTNAMMRYDEHVQGQSVIEFGQGWQFLGQQDSWFVRYLAASLD